MNFDWEMITLDSIAEIIMGQSPLGETCCTLSCGVPLLNGPSEFGSHHPTPVQFTSDPKKKALQNDLLFCVRGSTTGRMNWADQNYAIGRGLAALRHKNGKDYQPYLRALVENLLPSLLSSATGSTFPNVSRDQLAKAKIRIPSQKQQLVIAKILGSIEGKIELNRQMCKTLEGIASALFKSWFINFDPVKAKINGQFPNEVISEMSNLFPDYLDDSPVGKIPCGWKMVNLHDVTNIVYGKNLPTSELIEDGFPVFGGNGLIGYYTTFLYDEQQVVIACRGAASGKIHRTIPKSYVTNNSLICEIVKNNCVNKYYLEYMLKHLDMTRYATGSAQPQITIQNLKNVTFWVPKKELMIAFGEIISSIHEKVLALNIHTKVLSEIRDALLPKLISGEVRIQDAGALISATI